MTYHPKKREKKIRHEYNTVKKENLTETSTLTSWSSLCVKTAVNLPVEVVEVTLLYDQNGERQTGETVGLP